MINTELVKVYEGQLFHMSSVFGLRRSLPIVPISDGLWIASDAGLVLSDAEFIRRAGVEVARAIGRYRPEIVVTAETKAIAMTYEVTRNLGLNRFVVVRKSVKGYMRDYITEGVNSITTREPQVLVLTIDDSEFIRGRRVCLFDDVVSTGSTMNALERLVERVGGEVACRACIWREGPWYTSNDLLFFDSLPIYMSRELYNKFVSKTPSEAVSNERNSLQV